MNFSHPKSNATAKAEATAVEEPLHKSRRKRNLEQKQPKTKINITARTHKNFESQSSMLGKNEPPGSGPQRTLPKHFRRPCSNLLTDLSGRGSTGNSSRGAASQKQKKTQSETKTTENEDQHHSTHPQKQ
jgi:hypothetical protein